MIDKKKLSKEIEERFEEFKKEGNFKFSLEEFDSEFSIKDLIFSNGFVSEDFLRQICLRIAENYSTWNNYLNNLLLPNPSYLAGQTESKLFQSKEEQSKLWELIKMSMKFSNLSSLKILNQNREEELQFVDEAYASWINYFKPGLLYLLTKVSEAWSEK